MSQPNQLSSKGGWGGLGTMTFRGVGCYVTLLSLSVEYLDCDGRKRWGDKLLKLQLQDSDSFLHLHWMREQVCCEPFATYLFSNLYLLRSQHPKVRF